MTLTERAKSCRSRPCPTISLSWMMLFDLTLLCMPVEVLQNNCKKAIIPVYSVELAAHVHLLPPQTMWSR